MDPIRRRHHHHCPAHPERRRIAAESKGAAARILALITAGALGLLPIAIDPGRAAAQGITTGALQGQVRDRKTNEPMVGVTVAATADRDTVTTITEEDGTFRFTGLVPGTYTVTFFYGDSHAVYDGIDVGAQRTAQVFHQIDLEAIAGERIDIVDRYRVFVDPSARLTHTVDRAQMENLPIPGRSYLSTLSGTAGAHGDGVGPGFSGSSGLENQYIVDGVNTTGLRYGSAGSPILNDFVEQTEVITGGYNAEYGRSTGGVVNVVTRSGDNRLAGLIFASVAPGFLAAGAERAARQATSIDVAADLDVAADVGVMVSGPVIKDKLWFVVGGAPSYNQTTLSRTTKRQLDVDQNGIADVDPETGFRQFQDITTREFRPWSAGVQGLGKLNVALAPEHQGQLSVVGGPSRGRTYGMYGLAETTNFESERLTGDVALRWTSKFDDNKTELEAVLGWHHDHVGARNVAPAARTQPLQLLRFGDLGEWSKLGFEDAETRLACSDGVDDLYPGITNCPDEGVGYRVGGGGTIVDDTEDRYSMRLGVTRRVRAFGSHELKAGLDAEINQLTEPRIYTGGVFFENRADEQTVTANRWIQIAPVGGGGGDFDRACSYTPTGSDVDIALPCKFIDHGDVGSTIAGETLNWAAFLRDSWQIQPNLTVDAGLRYEEQRMRYAGFLQGQLDPSSGQPYGTNALTLRGMFAPRLGAVYDWTRDGRSKVYAHWGRFYESIPMDINSRSFGGEVSYRQQFGWQMCGTSVEGFGGPSAMGCPEEAAGGDAIGVGGTLVAPGLESQYLDEALGGVEYELAEDLKVGLSFQHRGLGRVIEDVSTDGAQTYVIANPGQWSEDEEARLRDDLAAATAAGRTEEAARLNRQLAMFTGIRDFDRPRRDHDALQLTLARRFSHALFLEASYTWSRTRGNYPGLVSYDNGQIDPNISSQYDLIELTSNRAGPLPQDRTHNLKIDGYYRLDFEQRGALTLGWRARLASGTPRDALAGHPLYGIGESFLLPRGSVGRTALEQGLDVHVGYGVPLARGMNLEVFADVFNVFDHQGQAGVDEDYSYRSDSYPIVGGTYEDLIFAKSITQGGLESPEPIIRNADFGNTVARSAPLSARLGARLSF